MIAPNDRNVGFTSTKTFPNLPCAHRQWRHDGVCAHVHGYSRSFHFVFASTHLDACGFVVDFGKLKVLKAWLEDKFDHTLLINDDDPLMADFQRLERNGACKLVIPPLGVGMESCAKWAAIVAQKILDGEPSVLGRGCRVVSVECRENDKNSAVYTVPLVNPTPRGDALPSTWPPLDTTEPTV